MWLKSDELAVLRVQERIRMGGHSVPESTIRRRYHRGLMNFFNLYQPIADGWKFYDNSDSRQFSLIASKKQHEAICIRQTLLWQKLEEYNGKQ